MEFRKIFDTIPEQFDKYRPRYSQELFDNLIEYAKIGKGKNVLEIGPGTGQATEPILKSGCNYNAIELGENLFQMMKKKFSHYPNFNSIRKLNLRLPNNCGCNNVNKNAENNADCTDVKHNFLSSAFIN